MSILGGGYSNEPYSNRREIGDLYEKIGRRFVNEGATDGGSALVQVVIELQQDVARLTREIRDLRADLRKPKAK